MRRIGAIVDDVLGTPAFGETLRQLSEETGRPISELRAEAEADLKEMAARPGHYSVAAWDRFSRWLSRAYRLDYRPEEVRDLRRMNQTVVHQDTPVIRGMINKVSHLVKVEE